MKVVFIKSNYYEKYKIFNLNGYIFKPKNKRINDLRVINKNLIKCILKIKISKEIGTIDKTIKLMIKSNVTDISDCNMMLDEINRITNKLEKKYKKYFDEFEYFDNVKDLYFLNMEILSKKKLLEVKS